MQLFAAFVQRIMPLDGDFRRAGMHGYFVIQPITGAAHRDRVGPGLLCCHKALIGPLADLDKGTGIAHLGDDTKSLCRGGVGHGNGQKLSCRQLGGGEVGCGFFLQGDLSLIHTNS